MEKRSKNKQKREHVEMLLSMAWQAVRKTKAGEEERDVRTMTSVTCPFYCATLSRDVTLFRRAAHLFPLSRSASGSIVHGLTTRAIVVSNQQSDCFALLRTGRTIVCFIVRAIDSVGLIKNGLVLVCARTCKNNRKQAVCSICAFVEKGR